MLEDYIPVISGLLALFVVALLYDPIQSFLKRKSSSLNKQLITALNVVVVVGVFVLVGLALYFTMAALLSGGNGFNELLNIKF